LELTNSQKFFFRSVVTATSFVSPRFGKFARMVWSGFSEDDKRAMLKRLAPLQVGKQPMNAARKSFRKARWVKPVVLVDAEFRGKTGGGLFRHPAFKGFRDDLT
jgi:bifunctional non-homologous end joining protein LigD